MFNEKMEALVTANEYLDSLKGGILRIIEVFQEEDENTGCELISQVSYGIKWVIDVVNLTRDVQKEHIDISGINEKLEEIVEAIENEDFLLVGDLFKYEILPIIIEIHNKIKDIIF